MVDTLRHSAPALVLLLLMTLTLTTVFGTMVYFFEGGVFKVRHMQYIGREREVFKDGDRGRVFRDTGTVGRDHIIVGKAFSRP